MHKYNLKEWWYDLSVEDREILKKIVLDEMQMDLEEGELEEDRQGNTSNSNSTDEIIIEKIYKSTQQQSTSNDEKINPDEHPGLKVSFTLKRDDRGKYNVHMYAINDSWWLKISQKEKKK